jgi:NADPH:quinone reductase-like Zn-dependent oxidoreductase
MAKLSGFSFVVTTSSPHNAPYLKSLGATHVIDRTLPLPSLLAELEKIDALPKFEYAFDAYGRADTSLLQAMTVLVPGGKCVTVAPRVQFEVEDGKTLAKFSAEKHVKENVPHLRALLESGEATRLLESGKIKVRLPCGLLKCESKC